MNHLNTLPLYQFKASHICVLCFSDTYTLNEVKCVFIFLEQRVRAYFSIFLPIFSWLYLMSAWIASIAFPMCSLISLTILSAALDIQYPPMIIAIAVTIPLTKTESQTSIQPNSIFNLIKELQFNHKPAAEKVNNQLYLISIMSCQTLTFLLKQILEDKASFLGSSVKTDAITCMLLARRVWVRPPCF